MIKKQRINDTFIMNDTKSNGVRIQYIQQCRLYLQIATLSDITKIDGTQLKKNSFHKKNRASNLTWPHQRKPTKQAWTEWRKYLRTLLQHEESRTSARQISQQYRLGAWISTHQKLPIMVCGNMLLHKEQFYHKTNRIYKNILL